ncbi:MAG: carboxypeptidase-like regulatory domain-containing protein, partial [Bacteroidota bacterium]
MKKNFTLMALLLLFGVGFANLAFAQGTSVSGQVTDATTGEPLAGVNIVVKGKVIGTISGADGNYSLNIDQAPPLTLSFSFIGFETQEIEITNPATTGLNVSLEEGSLLGQEVVVSASRVEESILESPVSIEKLDIRAIRESASPSFYDQLKTLKGI